MKLLILSDSHESRDNLKRIISKILSNNNNTGIIEGIIYLGDGVADLLNGDIQHQIKLYDQDMPIYYVTGNEDRDCYQYMDCNDWVQYNEIPIETILYLGDKKVFITHGDHYRVKENKEYLLNEGKAKGSNVILFGHTHIPFCMQRDGILMLNPGAVENNRYCVLEI